MNDHGYPSLMNAYETSDNKVKISYALIEVCVLSLKLWLDRRIFILSNHRIRSISKINTALRLI
jgi:hypothetical protein